MKHKKIVLAVAVAGALSAAAATAGGRWDDDRYYVYARVTDVQPIVRTVQVATPREVCWEEKVRNVHHASGRRDRSFTPTVVGTIVGGVIGNQFGRGRGKDAATVAGALLGAAVGNDYARERAYERRGGSHVYYTTEERCEIDQVYHEEERIEGYRVSYRYQGRDFVTRTDTDPGDRIRVRVQVEPVAYNGGGY
jgi:uncharacterized protein YcfJ